MHMLVVLLVCLVCIGDCRRVKLASDNLQGHSHYDYRDMLSASKELQLHWRVASPKLNPLKTLAMFLNTHSPAAGWQLPGQVQRLDFFGHRYISPATSRSVSGVLMGSEEGFANLDRRRMESTSPLTAMPASRRDALLAAMATPVALAGTPAAAFVDDKLETSWIATQGFNESAFITFDLSNYIGMRDDGRRTPVFKQAIEQRLAKAPPGTMTVLDLGTGPFAIFALMAARAGAKKVYAIESNFAAAQYAKKAVRKAESEEGLEKGIIEVLTGFSTDINLPEKVDLMVAEICGVIASEEGIYATYRDAQERFMKRPTDPNSYIPSSVQTLGSPASYSLHYSLGPPKYDWSKLGNEPVRVNCRDANLNTMSDPLLVEEIRFSEPMPKSGIIRSASNLEWRIDPVRLSVNEKLYYGELLKKKIPNAEADELARNVARSFSGIAFWPRLVLDPEGTLVVESRGPKGEKQRSHWQTAVTILSERPPSIEPGAIVRAKFEVDLQDGKVQSPLKYTLKADITAS